MNGNGQEPDPIDRLFDQPYQGESPTVTRHLDAMGFSRPPEKKGTLRKIAEGAHRFGQVYKGIPYFGGGDVNDFRRLFSPEHMVYQSGYISGLTSSGIISPVKNASRFLEMTTSLGKDMPEGPMGVPVAMDSGKIGDAFGWFADTLERLDQELYDMNEQNAIDAGVDKKFLAESWGIGNVIGFLAPIAGSTKAMSVALRQPMKGVKPLSANIITDTSAGLLYGGVFMEGDNLEDRFWHSLQEGGYFLAGSAVLLPAIGGFNYWRAKRLNARGSTRSVRTLIDDMREAGMDVRRSDIEMIMQMASEEGYVAASPKAMQMIIHGAEERSLVQAIMDVDGMSGNSGFIKNFDSPESVKSIRQQYPDLAVEEVAGGVYFGPNKLSKKMKEQLTEFGAFKGQQVYVKGAPDNSRFFFAGKSKEKGKVTLGSSTGKFIDIEAERMGTLPGGRSTIEAQPQHEALYRSFRDFVEEGMAKEANMATDMSQETAVQAAREGRLNITDDMRRGGEAPGVVWHPEELGTAHKVGVEQVDELNWRVLDAEGNPKATFQATPTQSTSEEVFDGIVLIDDIVPASRQHASPIANNGFLGFGYQSSNNELMQIARQVARAYPNSKAVAGRALDRQSRFIVKTEDAIRYKPHRNLRDNMPNITVRPEDGKMWSILDGDGDKIATFEVSRRGKELTVGNVQVQPKGAAAVGTEKIGVLRGDGSRARQEMIALSEDQFKEALHSLAIQSEGVDVIKGWKMTRQKNFVMPTQRLLETESQAVTRELIETGMENAAIRSTPANLDVDHAFRKWAERMEIPVDSKDFLEMRASFMHNIRQDLWKGLPASERRLLGEQLEQMWKVLDEGNLPIASIAASKGFSVRQTSHGRVIMQEINTGRQLLFNNLDDARTALDDVIRTEKELVGGTIDMGEMGVANIAHGMPRKDPDFKFSENMKVIPDEELSATRVGRPNVAIFETFEDQTKVPIWSQGFDPVIESLGRFTNRLQPHAQLIDDIWSPIKPKRRQEVVEFWQTVEGKNLKKEQIRGMAKEAGLADNEIKAMEDSAMLFRHWGNMAGLPEERFISFYYTRLRPYMERNKRLDGFKDAEGVAPEDMPWYEMSREIDGHMPQIEMDPAVVMQKYVRSVLWKQEVSAAWNRARDLSKMRIKDLPEEQMQRILEKAPEGTSKESFLINQDIRAYFDAFLDISHGRPSESIQAMRKVTNNIFNKMGIKADERVLEEAFNMMMGITYGAGLGLRASAMVRDGLTPAWFMWSRLGGEHMTEALEAAMKLDAFDEVTKVGGLPSRQTGIIEGNQIADTLEEIHIQGKGVARKAAEWAMRAGLATGRIGKDVARKTLVPYSNMNEFMRVWSYQWQKMHTEKHLQRYRNGDISWERFTEEGLPFYGGAKTEKFGDILRIQGEEEALQYIGRQAADETNFMYLSGTQAPMLQKTFGRLMGQFGNWPLNAVEYYRRAFRNGTMQQRFTMAARTALLTVAVGNAAHQTGTDLWNWVVPASLTYVGGPFLDHAINMRSVIEGPGNYRVQAFKNMMGDFASLSLPGQVAFREMHRAMGQDDATSAAASLFLGKPLPGHKSRSPFDQLNDMPMQTPDPELIDVPWEEPSGRSSESHFRGL